MIVPRMWAGDYLFQLGSNEFFSLPFDLRQDLILKHFQSFAEREDRYKALMNLRTLPLLLPESLRSSSTLVRGCQSEMHLLTTLREDLIYIEVYSESLISLGLASLLFLFFHRLSPNAPFTYSPSTLFTSLDLSHMLSAGRSNGFFSMLDHLKKQIVLLIAGQPCVKN